MLSTSQPCTKSRLRAFVALLGLLLGLVAIAPSISAAGGVPDREAIKQDLWNRLEARGLNVANVSSCKDRDGFSRYICQWRAEGMWPGEIPYRCSGRARYDVAPDSWRIQRCRNQIASRVPLTDQLLPHPLFGYNESWNTHANRIGLISGSGSEIARQELYWTAVERERGTYDWDRMDGYHDDLISAGVTPLYKISGSPCWAQQNRLACENGNTDLRPTPEHYNEMADFAVAAAGRYDGEIAGIEVWNEPNSDDFWGGAPQPERWAQMVGAVADAVHAADSDVPVVSGGLHPFANAGSGGVPPEEFLNRAYREGGPQRADAIGYHPYAGRAFDDDYLGSIRIQLFEIQRAMRAHGDAGKDIWATETGVSTAGPGAYGEGQQAEALERTYHQFRRIEGVPVVVYHRFADQSGGALSRESGYGVINQNGLRKMAYCRVAAEAGDPGPCG